MAYNIKDVFYLDTKVSTGTSADAQCASLDVSAYIEPVARGKSKATGLAIYKVHWDLVDVGSNSPIAATTTGTFRAGLLAGSGLPEGTVSLATDVFNAGNDLMISVIDFWAQGTSTGDPGPVTWLQPSAEVPYVVVRDSLQIITNAEVAMSAAAYAVVRLECAQITLDQATLNQLIRTQTV